MAHLDDVSIGASAVDPVILCAHVFVKVKDVLISEFLGRAISVDLAHRSTAGRQPPSPDGR